MRMLRATPALLVLTVLVGAVPGPAGAGPVVNGRIVFTSERTGDGEIFLVAPDGSGQTNITNTPGFDDDPSWSRDGTRIAFTSYREGPAEIYVMQGDGSGQTNLTTEAAADFHPSWSPDGTRIAFVSYRDGNAEVYVMNADGSGQTNLTNEAAADFDPSWSPDGTRIAFTSDRDGTFDIFVMSASGSGATNITNNAAVDSDAAWSPDGTKIAFSSNRDTTYRIFTMAPEGSGQTPLMTSGYGEEPAWSPDQTMIAFTSLPAADYEVSVVRSDGSGQTNITNNPSDDYRPSWQPVPVPPLKVAKDRVNEGKKSKVLVTLASPPVGTIPVTFKAISGTAKRGKDFKPTAGTVVFAPGETVKVVRIKTREDVRDERRKETFFLRVTVAGVTAMGKTIILDDD